MTISIAREKLLDERAAYFSRAQSARERKSRRSARIQAIQLYDASSRIYIYIYTSIQNAHRNKRVEIDTRGKRDRRGTIRWGASIHHTHWVETGSAERRPPSVNESSHTRSVCFAAGGATGSPCSGSLLPRGDRYGPPVKTTPPVDSHDALTNEEAFPGPWR